MSKPYGIDETVLTEHASTRCPRYLTALCFANMHRIWFHLHEIFSDMERCGPFFAELGAFGMLPFHSFIITFLYMMINFITTVNIATRWYWWDCLWQGCRSDFLLLKCTLLESHFGGNTLANSPKVLDCDWHWNSRNCLLKTTPRDSGAGSHRKGGWDGSISGYI